MIEKIKKLKLKGYSFVNESVLKLFENDNRCTCSLIYGSNGSGKTTISRAIDNLAGNIDTLIDTAEFLDCGDNVISLPIRPEHMVYVFNEDFVFKNINFESNGLNTIVMFGEQGDLQKQISEVDNELETVRAEIESQSALCKEYQDCHNSKSPSFYMEKMIERLKGDKNWAGRAKEIKGKRVNSSVNKETVLQKIGEKSEKEEQELWAEYNMLSPELKQIREQGEAISEKVPTVPLLSIDFDDVSELLAKRIEKPELNNREAYLLELGTKKLQEIQATFQNPGTEICPFCLRPISSGEKSKIVSQVEDVLNKAKNEHLKELESINLTYSPFHLSPFSKFEKEILQISELDKSLSVEIENLRNLINEKHSNPYHPISFSAEEIKSILNKLNQTLESLKSAVDAYNSKIQNPSSLEEQLLTLNDQIACKQLTDLYCSYESAKEAADSNERNLSQLQSKAQTLSRKLEKLQSELNNIHVASELINNDLSILFMQNNRLSIEASGNNYIIRSRGKSVKPKNISSGERNALALAYFFTLVRQNKQLEDKYSDEALIVIDDPVSSFDRDNKIGIISLLQHKLQLILQGNINSRVVVLTHDLDTFYLLQKLIKSLIKKPSFLELRKKELVSLQDRNFQEHSRLIDATYTYANSDAYDESLDLFIGNGMRKMLEAISTFIYRVGPSELTTDEEILRQVQSETLRERFRTMLYRLVLNGESHTQDRARSSSDLHFCTYFSFDEKRETAAELLCFIYQVQPLHLKAHLKNNPGAFEKIQDWCKNLEENGRCLPINS